MKTIETMATEKVASAKAQLTGPVLLTVEQIAEVAAGFTAVKGPTTIAGGIRVNAVMPMGAAAE